MSLVGQKTRRGLSGRSLALEQQGKGLKGHRKGLEILRWPTVDPGMRMETRRQVVVSRFPGNSLGIHSG